MEYAGKTLVHGGAFGWKQVITVIIPAAFIGFIFRRDFHLFTPENIKLLVEQQNWSGLVLLLFIIVWLASYTLRLLKTLRKVFVDSYGITISPIVGEKTVAFVDIESFSTDASGTKMPLRITLKMKSSSKKYRFDYLTSESEMAKYQAFITALENAGIQNEISEPTMPEELEQYA